jgi:DNA invertase Pin-like site-specific DNA recombinase
LKDFAQKQGWEIVHQFSDHTSGKTSDREQFKKRFSAASRRRFDVPLFGV